MSLPPVAATVVRSAPSPVPDTAATAVAADVLTGAVANAACTAAAMPHADYWRGMLEAGPQTLVANFHTQAAVLRLGAQVWPLTINDRPRGSAYPCSLHTHYIAYPRAELGLVAQRSTRAVARGALGLLEGLLRLGQIDRTVQWSSWLLSTDLHPPELAAAAPAATRHLAAAYPRHALWVRNLHGEEQPDLPQAFAQAGYHLLTSRQIYFFDGRTRDFMARSVVKRDLKALRALRGYTVVGPEQLSAADTPRMAELYRLLYLEKHSPLNPAYTPEFVARALAGGWLEFRGLRHESGRLDGIFGCFTAGGTTSTPFIGHDTALPTELGLYRHLVSLLLQQVAERGQLLNYSSGAGEFKRLRGARPVIEYHAVYTRHLPPHRQLAITLLRMLVNRFGRSFLEKQKV